MHPILIARKPGLEAHGFATKRRLVFVMLSLLTACSSTPNSTPVEERRVVLEQDSVQTSESQPDDQLSATPLEQRSYQIEQAQRYEVIASGQEQEDAADATLSAAEFYVQAEDSQRAEQTVLELDPASLSITQLSRYQIVRAYAAYARGEDSAALARVETVLTQSDLSSDQSKQQRVDALLLASFVHQRIGNMELALGALIERESFLYGKSRAETSRYIGQVINTIGLEQREQMIAFTDNLQLRNRLEQSLTGQVGSQAQAPSQFEQWRGELPSAAAAITAQASTWSEYSPRAITVLLPESSRYQRAAQAVKDGIRYQHDLNQSPFRPILNFYDIGNDPWQISQFYSAAQQRGTDLIIGPLGKDYADTLLQSMSGQVNTPTVLLGGELPLSGSATRMTLSPENESRRIAERAAARGYINAVILAPNTQKGERSANAFYQHWLKLGGKVSKLVNYSPEQFDHSTEFKLMFDLQQSQARYRALSDTLGYRPEFSPYRRNDIDFIYLIADTKSGRVVRPQINFFGGNSMPVIASSDIYNGIEAVAENTDLNNTVFPAMPWELTSTQVALYAGQLNRLFALGSDAYQLAAELSNLRRERSRAISGNTGTLSVGDDGEVKIQPLWAVFRNGVPETDAQLTPLDPNTAPMTLPGVRNSRNNGSNSYDDSNWDPRQSRRKSGS